MSEQKLVLLLEDELLIGQMISSALKQFKVCSEVAWGKSISEFLVIAEQLSKNPQAKVAAIVLDNTLPDGKGYQIAQQVKALFPNVPILLNSGEVKTEKRLDGSTYLLFTDCSNGVSFNETEAKAWGIDGFITKPANMPDILNKIKRATQAFAESRAEEPAASADQPPSTQARPTEEDLSAGKEIVVIFEDNKLLAKAIAQKVTKAGYEAKVVNSRAEMDELIFQIGQTPTQVAGFYFGGNIQGEAITAEYINELLPHYPNAIAVLSSGDPEYKLGGTVSRGCRVVSKQDGADSLLACLGTAARGQAPLTHRERATHSSKEVALPR